MERQPAVRDLVAKAASRVAEHRARDFDGVYPSGRADPIQQELNPYPPPNPMSGKPGGVTELVRQDGVHTGSDAHAASLCCIRLLPLDRLLGGTVESCPRWIR